MNHATFIVKFLAVWLILLISAIIAEKSDHRWWPDIDRDIDEMIKRLDLELQDAAKELKKELIDHDCEACLVTVGAIQFLARENFTEDTIVDVLTKLCIKFKIKDKLVCRGIIPEFKVSAPHCYVAMM